jgi:hypothetical protein
MNRNLSLILLRQKNAYPVAANDLSAGQNFISGRPSLTPNAEQAQQTIQLIPIAFMFNFDSCDDLRRIAGRSAV